ncbi:MAG: phosphoenolpyruvate--protein phosphotransferase [Clostridiales bacterium]|nr:phosphoenolpyruvate--protein phosphotransferase [Clostridiales bacterium]
MVIKGIAASNGYAIAKIFKIETLALDVTDEKIASYEDEKLKFDTAHQKSISELQTIRDKAIINLGEEHGAIFEAHLQMIQDPELLGGIESMMENDLVNAAFALQTVSDSFIAIFESMENDYMKERAADIKDIRKRLLCHLLEVKMNDVTLIDEPVVVVAEDITPSETAQLNRDFVKGFATNIGGRTSHSAIMARSLEIPAVVGLKSVLEKANHGDQVILDGVSGEIFLNPTQEMITTYEQKLVEYNEKKLLLQRYLDKKSVTLDGHQVEMSANIGTPDDVDGIIANGGEGVGLYRTEFLYMGRSNFPTEEEQFIAYKTVLERMDPKPIVIRTLDIGGDKELSYLDMPEEMNPFLGYRAIRLCLDRKEIFVTQLRALLRASIHGQLKIMFPMIATISEFLDAKSILLETKEALIKEGIEVSEHIEVGMMVEIPAAAILADQFAKHVDFFSIGTNDLIQYTFAADRMNETVSYLYQPYNPSLLRLIKMVIDAAHKEGKWAGMCGEMAGDHIAIPLLLGLGLDEFSMSATSILSARALMSKMDMKKLKPLAEKALDMSHNDEVMNLVNDYLEEIK